MPNSEKFNIHSENFSTKVNTFMFNKTRAFLREHGIQYDCDMKQHRITVNHGQISAFTMRFEDYNYVRINKIPAPRFNYNYLVLAKNPQWILRRMLDFKVITFSEVSHIMNKTYLIDKKLVKLQKL